MADYLLNGYLGVNLDVSESAALGVISISLMIIGIAIQCGIVTIAFRHMVKKHVALFQFKLSFFLLFVFSCISTLVFISFTSHLMASHVTSSMVKIVGALSISVLWSFFTILLAILVLRLHVTFSETQLRMPSTTHHMFIAVLVMLVVLTIVNFSLILIVEPVIDENAGTISLDYPVWFLPLTGILNFMFALFFFPGSAWAVKLFISNLDKLAMAQASTPEAESMKSLPALNRRQQKFIDLAARYMLLFGIATASTILSMVLSQGFGWKSGIKYVFFAVDCTINILCVYLQFGFAAPHYRRCCGCLDRWCRRKLSKRTRMNMHVASNSVACDSALESTNSRQLRENLT